MADIIVRDETVDGYVPFRGHDNDDGTYSREVFSRSAAPNFKTTQITVSHTTGTSTFTPHTTSLRTILKNKDAANSIFVSDSTPASSSNSMELKTGESIELRTTQQIYFLAATADSVLQTYEEWT